MTGYGLLAASSAETGGETRQLVSSATVRQQRWRSARRNTAVPQGDDFNRQSRPFELPAATRVRRRESASAGRRSPAVPTSSGAFAERAAGRSLRRRRSSHA